MASIRHPLVGDPVYGIRYRPPAGAGEALLLALRKFPRQALHAKTLSFAHPKDGKVASYEAPVPDDMTALLASLDADDSQRP